jgi:flagellar motor switch protein FliN/FliY
MPEITAGTALHSVADVFRKSFSDVLSQTFASPWSVEIAQEEAPAPEDGSLCYGLSPSGSLQGNAAFQLRSTDARSLGQKLLKEPADATSELNPDHKQAIEGLLRQVAQQAAAAFKSQYGEVGLQVSSIEAPSWPGVTVLLVASAGPAGTLSLQVRLGNELLAALPVAPVAAVGPVEPAAANVPEDSNLDLLLGVDLSLTLRFGQRTLTLREILDLSSGSVIELDRRVQEPADLLLGDRLIARGEVVIVDSNYGLRITEVCDAQHSAAKVALSAGQ